MRGILLSAALVLGTFSTGCLISGPRVGVGYEAGYAEPGLVEVSPGVMVVEDAEYPVFYSDNLYWRQDGGVWYSSQYHDRGWGRSYNVPMGVSRIDRPTQYSHYRGNAGAVRRGPVTRDHRSAPARSAPAARPVVRDHRK